jgi:SPP1 gp7 family putative phage head morphogenesis protein
LQIGNIEIRKLKQEAPQPKSLGKEISSTDSCYFDGYALKPYNPAYLYRKRDSFELYDDMREDDQISSLLMLKKLIVLNADWEIECDDENVKEFLEKCFDEYLEGIFLKTLYDILSAMDYGFSVSEKIFDYIEHDGGTKIVLSKLKTRAPHTFTLPTDNHGELIEITQHTNGEDLHLDPEKFIIYSYNKEFDNPYGRSDLNRGVYRAYISKDALIKFWNIRLERFGMPTAVGKLPRGAGEAEKNIFKSILKNIQSKTSITMPEDFQLDLLEASKGQAEYDKAIDKYDTMIARKLLIPDLLGFSGKETGGGSYALGKEQFNIFYNVIEFIRLDIESIVNKEIIQNLVFWNFGNKIDAKFKFNKADEDRRNKDMATWIEAVKTGKVPVTNNHINWLMALINAPEITDEEFKKMEEEKAAFRDAIGNKENDNKQDEKKDDGEDENESKDQEQKKNFSLELNRELSVYEKKIDFAKIARETEGIENKYKSELANVFELSINALMNDIKSKKIIEKKRFDLVNKLSLKHTNKTHSLIKSILKDSYKSGASSFDRSNYKIEVDITELDNDDVAKWVNEYSLYITGVEEEFILGKVKAALIEGIRGGIGIKEMVGMLDETLKGYNVLLGASRLETIIRTISLSGFNEARAQQFEKFKDEIIAFQYSAILDGRTSEICLKFDKNGKGYYHPSEISKINPPNHFNCRSLLVPIFSDEEMPEVGTLPSNISRAQGNFWKTGE